MCGESGDSNCTVKALHKGIDCSPVSAGQYKVGWVVHYKGVCKNDEHKCFEEDAG